MTRARAALTLLPALLLGLAQGAAAQAPAAATAPVPVRVGEHAGYGRLVLDLPVSAAPGMVRDGDTVRLQLPAGLAPDIDAARRRLPPQVSALSANGSELVLTLAPQVQMRSFRLGNRLVLDLVSSAPAAPAAPQPPAAPATAASAAAPATPAPRPAPQAAPAPAPVPVASLPLPVPPVPPPPPEFQARLAAATAPPAAPPMAAPPAPAPPAAPAAAVPPASTVPPAATPVSAPAAPPPAAAAPAPPRPTNNLPLEEALPRPAPSGPVSLAVRRAGDSAITLPFDSRTGIAAFRRGNQGWVVIDEPRPLDLSPLRGHPRFGAAEVTLSAGATALRMPLDPSLTLRARREGNAWLVEAVPGDAIPASPIRAQVTESEGSRLSLPAGSVGRSVALRDPASGETLLVGTVRDASLGMAPARAYAAFALPPTMAGLLVVPQSDAVQVRALSEGFVVAAGPAGAVGLPLAAGNDAPQVAAAHLTRRFDLSAPSEAVQADRIRRLAAETGAAAPLARGRLRFETAEALMALGLGVEAHGVLALAAAEDPSLARDPRHGGLSAMAALLAGRLGETQALLDPRLDGSDEVALWRALRGIATGVPPAAGAPVLAATAPLIATYGPPLRRRLAPLVAEGLAAGGDPRAAERLLEAVALEPEATALARARILESKGENDAALAAYEEAARGRDRLQRARALAAGTELALSTGAIDAAEAAKRLDSALFAWRGDGFEITQRGRIADLRMRAGDARGALGILRETATLFPEQEPVIRPRLNASFAELFRDGAADVLPPSQAVTLFEENIDLLPPGPDGEAMITRLADRLLQLDLPGRAAALVARVMEAQGEGEGRAALGARLAAMRLADRDPAGARAALAASATDGLPPSLVRERRALEARALAEGGDPAGALALLGAQTDPPALELRAAIAAAAGDWPSAVPPLAALVARTLPPPGAPLDPTQRRTLLRLATAAALAGQSDLLARLARERGEAMREGPLSEPFRLLTSDPVRGTADLPRLAAELQLARGLPQALAAAGPAAGTQPRP